MKPAIIKLLGERYFNSKESDWGDIADRVSWVYPAMKEHICKLEFIPSSPTLMNGNNPDKKGTLSSCFTMKIEDSIEGIFDALKETAIVTKDSGGVGYDFSDLRGSDENISSLNRPSSGPLPFIGIFDKTLDGIRQGGVRRGAGMGMLDIDHKNILDFIEAKSVPGQFTRLNFSVRMTDKFYEQLEKAPNSIWYVKDRTSDKEYPLKNKEGNQVTVKQLWDIIIDRAWGTAEPGIFNSDIAFRQCSVTNLDKHVLSNPCVTGDTLILTDKGNIRIDSAVGQKVNVWNGNEFSEVEPKVTGENQDILIIQFTDGRTIKTTPYHKFVIWENCEYAGMIEAKDLVVGTQCKIYILSVGLPTETINHYFTSVEKITKQEDKEAKIYCFNEPKLHRGVFNGVLTGQCQEFVLIPYASCNLGSINLSKLVHNKRFDWDKFEDLIIKATHYLDGIIDANKFPVKKIKDMTLKVRPIGLGYMGLAHALYEKMIPYNSEKGFEFTEEVGRYLTLRSMKESVEMAKDKGHYEGFDYDTYMKANERFFNKGNCRNIDIEKLKLDIKTYGVRNCVTTSIAPTGTISFIADTSSGIEPVFALSYMRKIEKENKEYEIVYITDPIFEKFLVDNFSTGEILKIQESVVDHNGSCQSAPFLTGEQKKVFVVAGDISPMDHLEALSRAAVNCATSVSKTVNLPKDISKEEVAKVYIEAHKKGIIGVTCYRDGCREGILVHNEDSRPDDIIYHNAPKRPKGLFCDIHRVTYKGEKWIAFIGMFKDKPFEVFCGKVEDVNLSKHIEKGEIIKVSSGHYSFKHEDEILIKDIAKTFNNLEHDAITRAASQELQHGIRPEFVCDRLNKSQGDITSFSKVLARIIKHYIKDGTVASGKCEKCGSKIIYTGGCKQCSDPECTNQASCG